MNPTSNVWNDIFRQDGRVFEKVNPQVKQFAEKLKAQNGKTVLDLGCGTGRHVLYLVKQGFSVFGLDYAYHALQMTRSWLAEERLNAGLLRQNMYEPLAFGDQTFDGLISIQTLHHGLLRQIQTAVAEIERVLKPGGLVLVTMAVSKHVKFETIEVEPNTFVPQGGYEKGLPHHIFSEQGLRDTFAAFEILEVHEDGVYHRAIWARKKG